MVLTDLSIKRPVLAFVVNIMFIILGLFGLMQLGVREYPNIDQPVIGITTTYTGASPEIIETQITKIVEDAVAGIEGIDYMSSYSQRERSRVTLRFKGDVDLEKAANDVRDRIATAKRGMPDDADDPVVRKNDSDDDPVISLSLSSDQFTPAELTTYAEKVVQTQLEIIDGVASVTMHGARDPIMHIWLDPEKMAAYELTSMDIESALTTQNVEIPAGTINSVSRQFSVISQTDLNTVDDFSKLIVKSSSAQSNDNDSLTSAGQIVYLQDVATVELGSSDDNDVRARFNGENVVILNVLKQSSANPVEISKMVRELLPMLRQSMPEGMNIDVAVDTAPFINASLGGVYHTLVEAIILVVLVIFFFLRSLRAAIIPLVAVPVALIGTLFLMYVFGYSINTLTLLAMVLAIGLVVDDAIVMLENIHRYIEEGISPIQAAFRGAREIRFAIIAMTLTLAVVYLPLLFAEGNVGKLFIEFAMTLSCTVLISGFTALTLSPMMCSRLLKSHSEQKPNKVSQWIEAFLNKLSFVYGKMLRLCLSIRSVIVFLILLIFVACVGLFKLLPNELAPLEDRGMMYLRVIGQEGANVNYTNQYFEQIEEAIIGKIPEVSGFLAIIGVDGSDGFGRIVLEDWGNRERSQVAISREISNKMKETALGVNVMVNNPQSLGQRGSSKPVEVVMRSSLDYAILTEQAEQILTALRNDERLVAVQNDLRVNMPQLNVSVDRDRLALLDVNVDDVGRTLETAFGGKQVTRFKEGSDQYDVMLQLDAERRQKPGDLESVFVRANNGNIIPLSNLVTVTEGISPQRLLHFNKLRSVTFSAGLANGVSQAEGVSIVEAAIHQYAPDASIDYTGSARELFATGKSIYFVFIMALICIYLVLAAQFESWRDPFIILFTVPFACLGALLSLWLTGQTLNIYSQIGLITLIGLITKHGILIVEFANQLRDEGLSKLEAIQKSCSLRLRPILMTSAAMILGAIPLVLSSGAGAESRSSIGWVIVGGLLVGTILTLIIVPVIYSFISANVRKPIVQEEI